MAIISTFVVGSNPHRLVFIRSWTFLQRNKTKQKASRCACSRWKICSVVYLSISFHKKWIEVIRWMLVLPGHQLFAMSQDFVWSRRPLHWRRNERDGILNYQPHDCLLNRLFRRRSKKPWKLRVTGLCEGNSPVTGEFPAQKASNAENVSICWRHHDNRLHRSLPCGRFLLTFSVLALCKWIHQ